MARALPPGWPAGVPAPVGDAWIPDAVGWLLDRCPADFRSHVVLRRHPRVLAAFTAWHLQATETGLTAALGSARSALRDEGPRTVDASIAVLETELVRVQAHRRSLRVLATALDSGGGTGVDA